MTELICGGIRTRFKMKKTFKDFDTSFSGSDICDVRETVESCLNEFKKNSVSSKVDKRNEKLMQLLEDECNELKNQLYMEQQELKKRDNKELKIFKNIINILDQIDVIYRYAVESKDENLQKTLGIIKKQVNKQIREIGLEEIESMGEFLDPYRHKCVQAIEVSDKQREEIVQVMQKGYLLDREVLRYASVVAVK